MDNITLYSYAIPIFLALIGIEALYFRFALRRSYGWTVAGPNFVLAIVFIGTQALVKSPMLAIYMAAHEFRLFEFTMNGWWSWLILFVLVDFVYYWVHRWGHEIRWVWTAHSVHHSAQQITLSVAYRLGWTIFLTGIWLLFVPLCFLGFDPETMLVVYAINQLYQFWLHTETIPKLGWFERIFNTPSHHRVHHATNPEYLDRNYGGIFIVWDKLFGTFAEEKDNVPKSYGLIHQVNTLNPIKIAFAEWVVLFRQLRSARSLRAATGYLLAPPGWKPDGKGMTTGSIRKAKLVEGEA